MADLARLSFNQITLDRLSLAEAASACVQHHIGGIGVWRHKLEPSRLKQDAQLLRDSGVRVSSLCRGGMFPAGSAAERAERIDDNKRAIDQAHALGTDVLVLVCGAAPAPEIEGARDIESARAMIAEGIASVVPHARAAGVRLGIEPLHPMFAADRSAITTLAEALTLAEQFPEDHVGVVIDIFHIWWDVDLYAQIQRASGRILGFHVSDWLVPLPDVLMGRGMMGDGVIQIRRIREAVDRAGYAGPIEVEIFNRDIWNSEPDSVLPLLIERFLDVV